MKETRVLILVLLFACLSVFGCKKQEEPRIEVTIQEGILEEIEKSRPKEVFVYQVWPGDPGLWMAKFAELIGIEGEVEETEDLLFVKQGDRYLEVGKASNTVFYGDMARLWTEEPTPERTQFETPGNEETRGIALDWLSKFGFSREGLDSLQITVSDERFELTTPEGEKQPIGIVVGKNVEVRRRLDDLLIFGPGSKIKFYIGENGRINGFMAVWRQIVPSSDILGHKPVEGEPQGERRKPINAGQAFEALKKNPLDHLPLMLVHKIDIDKVEFGYYSRSAAEYQKYLQPVYVFYGTAYAKLLDGKESSVPYQQYVLALEEPLETIWPETQEFKLEPRREDEVPKWDREDLDEKGGQDTIR